MQTKRRCREVDWQRQIHDLSCPVTNPVSDPSSGIDHAGNACSADSDHGKALFNSAEAGENEVLARAGRVAVPAIVGNIHHPLRSGFTGLDDVARENHFVADQR